MNLSRTQRWLQHLHDKVVDLSVSVSPRTSLLVGGLLVVPSTVRGVELEWPEEVVGLLE